MADATLVVSSDELVDRERDPCFLRLRVIGLRIETAEGLTAPGTWDFIERPAGLDAVVVVVWRRGPDGLEVLMRRALRIPAALGRPEQPRGPGRHPASFVEETPAGLVEAGDVPVERARAEVHEETGLDLPLSAFTPLGGALWETPGVCAEVLHWFAADATGAPPATPLGDGSPFETLVELEWRSLDDAIARCSSGDAKVPESLGDLRTELAFRRLRDALTSGRRPG